MNVTITYTDVTLAGEPSVSKTYNVNHVQFNTDESVPALYFYFTEVTRSNRGDIGHPDWITLTKPSCIVFNVNSKFKPITIEFDNRSYDYSTVTDGKIIENDLRTYLIMSQLQESLE